MKHSNFCPYCMSPVAQDGICSVCGLTRGSYTPQIHHLPPGTILKDRYLIGRVLGEGGFGITYIGCDLQLEVKVALKEYFPSGAVNRNASVSLTVTHYTGSEEAFAHDMNRFLKEARTMAKLSKQHTIVSVHDFFEENGTAYIVMEYIDGTTFKELVSQQGGKIASRELLYLIEPLFDALQAMHDAGLIHRDISPENIMLENGQVRLLDFGCAREATGDRTLTISLKHSYAPIEQYQGKGQGPWTDVHALGATIYYCVTGVKPPQAMDRLIDDELIPPRQLGADLTKTQEEAILKAMRVRPRQRFRSMTEFHAALYADVDRRVTPSILLTGAAAAVNVPEDEPEDADIDEKPDGLKKYALPGGIAAAVIAVILIIGIVMGVIYDSGTDGSAAAADTTDENTTAADLAEDSTAASYELIGTTAYVLDGTEEALRAALEDDTAESVFVSDNDIDLMDGILYINKPLTIEANVRTADSVIVGEGGELVIDCAQSDAEGLTMQGLLSTRDGGTITVRDGSQIYCDGGNGVLFLESWDDLTLEDGASLNLLEQTNDDGETVSYDETGLNHDFCFAIDEEAVFADAYEADSETALRAAMYDDSVSAVTVTADIMLTGEFTQIKPVRIAEGVTVTALSDEQALSEDGETIITLEEASADTESVYCVWNISGTLLINHGTMRGCVNTADPDEAAWSGDEPYLINDGTLTVSGDTCRGGCLVNLEDGTFNYMYGSTNCQVVNLGTFLHSSTVNGANRLDIHDPGFVFLNSGTIQIESNAWQTDEQTVELNVADGALFNLSGGSIRLGENAQAANYGSITNYGSIVLTDSSAVFLNHRYTALAAGSTLDVRTGQFDNNGIIQSADDASFLGNDGTSGHWMYGLMYDVGWNDDVTEVTNASEFEAALSDGNVSAIWITEEIIWEGDLSVSGKALFGDVYLTISGGDLILSGSDTSAELDGVNLSGGDILLSEDATMLLHEYDGGVQEVGTLEVTGGALLMTTGDTYLADMQIVIEGEGSKVLHNGDSVTLVNCEVQVEDGGGLGGVTSDSEDDTSTVTISSGGAVWYEHRGSSIACSIVNEGTIEFYSDVTITSGGSLTNYGELYVGQSTLAVQGTLDNQGTITEENEESTQIIAEDGGTIHGYE